MRRKVERKAALQSDRAHVTLFHPREVPIQGMNATLDPMMLGPGQWSLLQNIRLGTGLPRIRGGTQSLGEIIATGTFRGWWAGPFNGTYTIFIAVKDGSAVKVFSSTDAASWATEITAASGAYGNTRLSDVATLVQFEKVKDPFGATSGSGVGDCLIIQNGTDAPRVWSYSKAASAYRTAIIEEVPTQKEAQDRSVLLRNGIAFPLYNAANTDYATIAPSGANIVFTDSTGTVSNKIVATIGTSIAANDHATVKFGSAIAILNYKQLLIGIETGYIDLLRNIKIEIGTESAGALANAVTVFDGSQTLASYVVVNVDPTGRSNRDLLVLDLQAYGLDTASTFTCFRITWVGSVAPSSSQVVNLWYIGGQGTFDGSHKGGTRFAITNYNQGSKTESAGVVYSVYRTQEIGPSAGASRLVEGLLFPESEHIYYDFWCPFANVSTTERDKGVDRVMLYKAEPGGEFDTIVNEFAAATFSGTWSYTYSSPSTGTNYVIPSELTTLVRPGYLPDAFQTQMQTAKAVGFANGRLFTGSKNTNEPSLWISEYANAFRYRRFAKYQNGFPVESSGTTHQLKNETVQKILGVAGSTLGVDTVYVWTETGMYGLYGSSATQLSQVGTISEHGTTSPASVQQLNGVVFWLDKEMQVRRMSGGSVSDPSRHVVDSLLKGIPGSRRAFAYGMCFGDRYYLAYTPSGATTNTRILVWEDQTGQWTLDVPPKAAEGLMSWFDGTNLKLRSIIAAINTNAVHCYEYDVDTVSQDLGSNIAFQLDSYELGSPNFDKKFFVRRVGFLMDKQSAGSATVTRTYKPHGGTGVGTMLMTSSNNQIWRWDGEQTIAALGNGASCQISISGSAVAGSEFYRIVAEIQGRGFGPDR